MHVSAINNTNARSGVSSPTSSLFYSNGAAPYCMVLGKCSANSRKNWETALNRSTSVASVEIVASSITGTRGRNGASALPPHKCSTTCAYIGRVFTVTFKHNWATVHSLLSTPSCGSGSIIRCQCSLSQMQQQPMTLALSHGAMYMLSQPNAGGNSILSEALSMEIMHRCFGAKLLLTELEIEYFPSGGSITDYVCSIYSETVAVSVTRAMKYPTANPRFTWRDANRLLHKKLTGITCCNATTLVPWSRHVLFIWCYNRCSADKLSAVFTSKWSHRLNGSAGGNHTVLMLVTTPRDGANMQIFT